MPPNTVAGDYTFTYSVCENLNPGNCQTASVTISVAAGTLIAEDDDFSTTPVNGVDGGIAGDVTLNDTLDGAPVDDADIYIVNNGGLNGVAINANGNLIVPPNTPQGTYTVSYSICETLNPGNCDSAQVTVVVQPSDITLIDDDFSATPISGRNGGIPGNVLANDELNDSPIDPADVNVTLVNNGGLEGLAINDNGNIIVPPNTVAGDYTFTYSVCENLNPGNCQTASVTISVAAGTLIAEDDDFSTTPVNGVDGGIAGDVTLNDTLDGAPVDDADIYIVNNGGLNGVAINANGNLIVPPNTPQGTYTVSYSICETLNPGNCDSAQITIVVQESGLALIKDAVFVDTDANASVNIGDIITYTFSITNTGSYVIDDLRLNDSELGIADLAITPSSLAPGERASLTIDYSITQSDIDFGRVINTASISGIDENDNAISDVSDSGNAADDTGRDDDATVTLLNGNSNLELLKVVRYEDTNGDGLVNSGDNLIYNFTVNNNGSVTINDITIVDDLVTVTGGPIDLAPGESDASSFSAEYTITPADVEAGEVINIALATGVDTNGVLIDDFSDDPTDALNVDEDNDGDFEDPTVFVINEDASIELLKMAEYVDANSSNIPDLGDIIRYTFVVTNTGNTTINNITITDELVTVIGGPISLAPGESDATTFYAEYAITRSDVMTGYVDNTASVYGTTQRSTIVTDISDDPTNSTNEDANGDGNPDDPTRLVLSIEDVFIYNVITPNGDGLNDQLVIGAIERFPDNTLRIFNRWGVEVFKEENYGQPGSEPFRGYSNGRVVIDSGELLPTGTYFYVLEYVTQRGNTRQKAGYIYIN